MKSKILLLIFIQLLTFNLKSVTIYAQWVQQSCPTSENLYDVSFINRYTGWACGNYGEIIKTTNGGANWFMQSSGVEGKLLRGIFAIDSNFVYCVGFFETILKTTNGGTLWQVIRNGTTGQGLSYMRLYFLNKDTGWLMKNYYILKTTNGCANFDSCYVNHSYMWDIQFKNVNTGLICGDGSVVLKTTNSGINWYECPIPVGYELPAFNRISIVGNTCWCISEGSNLWQLGHKVFKSTNYGDSWDTITRVPNTVYGSTTYCNYFTSLDTGYCGGGGVQAGPRMFKTTNGGYNWYLQNEPNPNYKSSMWFFNNIIGWSVGQAGEILFTTTGGQWADIKKITNDVPTMFQLYQNYPNPFNPSTNIEFDIFESSIYQLDLYDILGRKIKEIFKQEFKPGKYKVTLDASDLSNGVYFYSLQVKNKIIAKKMTLVK